MTRPLPMFALILSLCAACGKGGGMDTGGGNIDEVRTVRVRTQLERLQADLRHVLASLTAERISDPEARALLGELLGKGFADDVARSTYRISRVCHKSIDGKPSVASASAGMNDRGGEICFSLTDLARKNASEREILALAIHEHAHHLGYGEHDALRIGEALAGFFGAQLFFQHRIDLPVPEQPTLLAEDGGGKCLDLSKVYDRLQALAPRTPAWRGTYDIQIGPVLWTDALPLGDQTEVPLDETAHAHLMTRDWFDALAYQAYEPPTSWTTDEMLSAIDIYQDGCRRLILQDDDQLHSLPITSFSPTEIHYEGSIDPGDSSLLSGSFAIREAGSITTVRMKLLTEHTGALSCRPESELTSVREKRRLVLTHDVHFGEDVPRNVSISSSLAKLLLSGPAVRESAAKFDCIPQRVAMPDASDAGEP